MAAKFLAEVPFAFDFTKYVGDFKLPHLDVETYINAQRKNVEALTQANRLAYDGLQAVSKRQIEIVRQELDRAAAAARDVTEPGTPQDKAAKQAEVAKESFERVLSNLKELGELVAKANAEAFELLQARFSESLDEMRDQFIKLGGK